MQGRCRTARSLRETPHLTNALSLVPDQSTERSCSVVIPTCGRPVELDRCLRALATQDYPNFDVIVVDNSSGNPETRRIAERWGARYVVERRRGLCRARNRGALVSSADIIAYVDDDAIPQPGWLAGLARMFDDDKVMGASGKWLPFKIETESEQLFHRVRGKAGNRDSAFTVDRSTPNWFEICGFGGIGAGCNMAVRRKAFEVWAGFHERTGRGTPLYGGDEQHAFLSLVDLGYRVAYTPDATVLHPFPSTMDVLRSSHLRRLTASTAYFTMMLVEGNNHRLSTLKYLWEAVRKKPRTWRGTPETRPRIVSPARGALALLLGPVRYIQGVFSRAS